jgi:hypothetical protein
MMHWILFLALMGGYHDNISATSIEFNSQAACISAEQAIASTPPSGLGASGPEFGVVQFNCLPKGDKK